MSNLNSVRNRADTVTGAVKHRGGVQHTGEKTALSDQVIVNIEVFLFF